MSRFPTGYDIFEMDKQNTQHVIKRDEAVIIIRDLYKSFEDLDVLKGVNLNVYKGENVAILGKSGSGKSVLIKMIVGLLKPDKGEVSVFGEQVDTLKEKELNALRLRIAFLFKAAPCMTA